MNNLKQTHLYQEHINMKAHMVAFSGYSMPVQYKSIKEEYLAVRHNQGMFDISHMCPILVKHQNINEIIHFLQYITCKDISTLKIGKVMYNAMLNKNAGILDDITIYYLKDDTFLLIINASNAKKIQNHLYTYKDKLNSPVDIEVIQDYILLAIQGPNAEMIFKKVLSQHKLLYTSLYYYENYIIETEHSFPYVIAKTGYTGENGFEILIHKGLGTLLWQSLLKENVAPCGLASRDILRLEMFYSLYGNELNENFTPYESNLKWLVSLNKDFLGKNVLLEQNSKVAIIGFLLNEEGIPRKGCHVYNKDKEKIGEVTSGNFSFSWKKGFGLMRILNHFAINQKIVYVKVRNEYKKATLYKRSPYQGSITKCP